MAMTPVLALPPAAAPSPCPPATPTTCWPGELWRGLGSEERQPFEALATADKVCFFLVGRRGGGARGRLGVRAMPGAMAHSSDWICELL